LHAQSELLRTASSRETFASREYLTRVLLRLVTFAERRGVDPFDDGESVRPLSERIERSGTLASAAAVVEAMVTRVFARLAEHAADGRIVSDIKRAVHRGYALPTLSTDDIARAAGVSSTYACRVFKDATGETIHRYVTAYRLERAKDLLLDGRQPKMAEVASRAGFSDANYFARAFRRETGQSPSEFREGSRR
jgi:two-component system response regulator YesN